MSRLRMALLESARRRLWTRHAEAGGSLTVEAHAVDEVDHVASLSIPNDALGYSELS